MKKLESPNTNEKLEKFVELCEMRTGNFHGDAVGYHIERWPSKSDNLNKWRLQWLNYHVV
jgi:hypothetical protein